MQKIIYSIVAALILSVFFTPFVPEWFLEGDALWTYQNPAARVDIRFSGHLKNGRVGAEGAESRISQPAWLSTESYQGTCVHTPISYRNKTCRIKLTPKADEWGKDAALVIELKGRDFRIEGKRRPAWVCFRNINLNGHPVAEEKVVWYNTPFVLKYPLHPSPEITLAFDVCKPLAASDISFVNILAIFSVFLLLSLFLFFIQLNRAVDHVSTFIGRRDIVKILSDGYVHIDPVYRRSFWIMFGVLCFAFGFHTINFMWGNHDWSLLDRTHHWLRYAGIGRYMLNSVKMLLAQGIYLPLIYDLLVFITLAINAVLLCKYWRLEKRIIHYVLCGLVLTVQPFTLSMLYYVHMIPEVFIGVTCVLGALLLSEKVTLTREAVIKKTVYSLIAIVLVNFALAMYPVLISTIAVAFVGRLLVQSFNWDGSRRQLMSCLKAYMMSAINIILGVASYKLIITCVFPAHSFYNTDTIPFDQIPKRVGVLLCQSVHQLYEYDFPFLRQWTLWVFLGFTILLTLYICFTGNLKQKIVRIFLLFGSLFATQTTMLIAKTQAVVGRVDFFGFVLFEVLVMLVIMTVFKKIHNLWVITGACIILASVCSDLDCLRVWKFGFDAEKMLWNRVLARLEIQDNFDPSKKYDVVQIGWSIAMRPHYYADSKTKFDVSDDDILDYSYDQKSNTFGALEFYYPTRFRSGKRYSAFHRGNPEYEGRLKLLYQAGVLQKAEVWPKANGLIVWKDIILFVTDGKELERYRRQFERELGKK